MIFHEWVTANFRTIGEDKLVCDRAILEYLELTAGKHAETLGDGFSSMDKTHTAWILLDWQVRVLRRPRYGERLDIITWSRSIDRCYGNRDFEIRDENGELCVLAMSKWILMNTDKWSIARADKEVAARYMSEPEREALPGEKLEKPVLPDSFECETEYCVQRRDIDAFGHVHNTYYLDLAYEALPNEVYSLRPFDDVRITYKKEIRLGAKLRLCYSSDGGRYTVVIKSLDCGNETVHSIITMA